MQQILFNCHLRHSQRQLFEGFTQKNQFMAFSSGAHNSWGPNFLGTKFPGDQISLGPNFLGTKFLGDQISWGPNFSGTKFLRDQKGVGPKFPGPKFLGAQISWGPKKSGAQMSSGTNSVTATQNRETTA